MTLQMCTCSHHNLSLKFFWRSRTWGLASLGLGGRDGYDDTCCWQMCLLFALYAGVMLLNCPQRGRDAGARCGLRGRTCVGGASMLLVGVDWLQLIPSTYGAAASAVLAVVGCADAASVVRRVCWSAARCCAALQYGLVAASYVVAICLLFSSSTTEAD